MSGVERIWNAARHAFKVFALLGLALALAEPTLGLAVVVTALFGLVVTHVTVAVVNYRRVMSRPWPEVRPTADDDDW